MLRFLLSLFVALCLLSCNSRAEYYSFDGSALGTTCHVVYQSPAGLNPQRLHAKIIQRFKQTIEEVNLSLSVYEPQSVISKVNRNEDVVLDSLFVKLFYRAKEITDLTGGAFDISASPYFERGGFGAGERVQTTQAELDSIAAFVGMDKFRIEGQKLFKSDPRATLNANAIAKGYASDLLGLRLEELGIAHFLVEIGGEIACKGLNAEGAPWSIGIDRPEYGNMASGANMQAIMQLSGGGGLATSGNYRRYYEENGQKFGHTIDPSTGLSVQHSLLSATVVAEDCMTADALATAFMVMGVEASLQFLEAHPQWQAYFIYSDASGAFQSAKTAGIMLKE
jgi:Membrane-associated lipoprotein involved in thiamine biosynthesis